MVRTNAIFNLGLFYKDFIDFVKIYLSKLVFIFVWKINNFKL